MDSMAEAMSSEEPYHGCPPALDNTHESSYGYLSMLLVALVGIKYQALKEDPFHEHGTIIFLFLIATFTYLIALTELKLSAHNNPRVPILKVICHVSGILANELLLLILFNPLRCFIINVSSILLVQALCYCYLYVSALLSLPGIWFQWIWHSIRKVESQSADVQMVESGAAIP